MPTDYDEGRLHRRFVSPVPITELLQRYPATFLTELDRANIISIDVSVSLWSISPG